MNEAQSDFPNFWESLLIVGLLMGLEVAISSGFYDFGVRFGYGDPRSSVVAVLGFGVVISLLLGYRKLTYRALFSPAGVPAAATLPLVLPIVVISFGTVVLLMEVSNILVHLFPLSAAELEAEAVFFSDGVVSILALSLVAPFVEEMLFRGIFLRSFLRIYSPRRAIVLSAIVFGLAHLNIYQFVTASALGVLLGWLYHASGSLWPGIALHSAHNGAVYLYVQAAPENLQGPATDAVPMHSGAVLLGAFAALLAGIWMLMKITARLGHRATAQAGG